MAGTGRRFVIPGDEVGEGNFRPGENVVRMGERLYATRVGLLDVDREEVRVIPVTGPYIPKVGDRVVGKVIDYSAFAREVDINAPLPAFLLAQEAFGRDFSPSRQQLTDRLIIGDLVYAKILAFDRTRDPQLSIRGPGLGKIPKGEIVKISPAKVPRVIGRRGSMVKIIEDSTRTRIVLGQNGVMVVNGPPQGMLMAVKAVRLVEQEAHTSGLTERVEALLKGSADW